MQIKQQRGGLFAGLVFGPLLVIVGYAIAFMLGKPILDHAWASKTWPQATGTITRSEIERSRSKQGTAMYSCVIDYEYVVDGKPFNGDTVWFGGGYSSSSDTVAREAVRKYPKGKSVKVYYSPEDPNVSVLEPGAVFSSYILFGIGLAFLIVGLLLTGAIVFKILLGGLLVGTVVATHLSSKQQSPVSQFAPPNFSSFQPPPNDPKDDGINIG